MDVSHLLAQATADVPSLFSDEIKEKLKVLGMEPIFICRPSGQRDAVSVSMGQTLPSGLGAPPVTISVLPPMASTSRDTDDGDGSVDLPVGLVDGIQAVAGGSNVGVGGGSMRLLGNGSDSDSKKGSSRPKFAPDYRPPSSLTGDHAIQLLESIAHAELCKSGVSVHFSSEPTSSYGSSSLWSAPLSSDGGSGGLAIVSDGDELSAVPVNKVKSSLLAHALEQQFYESGEGKERRGMRGLLEADGTGKSTSVVYDLSKAMFDSESMRQNTEVTGLVLVVDETEEKKGKKIRTVRHTRAVKVFGSSTKTLNRLVMLDAASLTSINPHAPVTRKDAASGKFKTSNEEWLPGVFMVTTTFAEDIQLLTPGRSLVIQLFKVLSDTSSCMFFEYVITHKDMVGFVTAVNGARLRLSAKVAATIGKVCLVNLTSDHELSNMVELRRLFGENKYGEVDPALAKPEFVKMHSIMRDEDAAVGVHLLVRSLTDVRTESIMLYVPKDLYLYPTTPVLHYVPTDDVDRWLRDGKHNRRGCFAEASVDVDWDGWVGGSAGAPFVLAPSIASRDPTTARKPNPGKKANGKSKRK
jgi:hypothetical protein